MTIISVVAQLLHDNPGDFACFLILMAIIVFNGLAGIFNRCNCDCDHDDDKK